MLIAIVSRKASSEGNMSEEMKALVLLLANAVLEMEDEKAGKKGTTSGVSDEIRRLTTIIRSRGG